MVDIGNVEATAATVGELPPTPAESESDFSPRKLKISAGVLVGQTFATSILPFSAMSLVMIPLTQAFGWSRTEFSFASTFTFIFGAISLWPIGRLTDRLGARPVILFGTLIVGLVTLLMAMQTKSLPMLYVCYALLGIFGSTGVAYMKVIAALFTQNRGKALAILGAESSVAGAFIPFGVIFLLMHFGWRMMYVAFGVVILCVLPLLHFTLEEPGETGADALRLWKRKTAATPAMPVPQMAHAMEGHTIQDALRDWVFWLVTISGTFGMLVMTGMMAHMFPAFLEKSFAQTSAVAMVSSFTISGLLGTLVGGWAIDRFQTVKIAAPFSLMSALSTFLLMIATPSLGGTWLLAAATAIGGFAGSAVRPMGTYFQTRFFGLKSFTEISSVQFMIINPVSAFGAPLIGAIYDRTHSYRIAWILMTLVPLVSTAVWLVLPKYRYAATIGRMPAPAQGVSHSAK